ncbi:hypothetical protein HC928_02020 [bacterium]|nr:hypothetical protein [bacterium]
MFESTSYLQRYRQYLVVKEPWHSQEGYKIQWHREAFAVWANLVSHASTIRAEPLYSDARAVAEDMMQHARHNVALIVERYPNSVIGLIPRVKQSGNNRT